MAPIFETVLNEIVKTCESEDGIKETTVAKDKAQGFSLDSDSSDEEVVGIDVDHNFIDEKASAIHALGNMGLNCAGLMLPHLERVTKVLIDELGFYFHENVRYHVCLTLTQFAFGLLKLTTGKADSDDKYSWTAGLPVAQPLPNEVQEFLKSVLYPHFMRLFSDESNKEVIEKTLQCIRDLAEEMGPASVQDHI